MYIILCMLFVLAIADPVPIGGANCTDDAACGGTTAGNCINSTCVCSPKFANVSCSYKRHSSVVPGALNIALPFIGVGGVGNFIIGNTGRAVGQLILMLAIYIVIIPVGFLVCAGVTGSGWRVATGGLAGMIVMAAILAGFAGFIWSIIDGAHMLECTLDDGNGFALYRGN